MTSLPRFKLDQVWIYWLWCLNFQLRFICEGSSRGRDWRPFALAVRTIWCGAFCNSSTGFQLHGMIPCRSFLNGFSYFFDIVWMLWFGLSWDLGTKHCGLKWIHQLCIATTTNDSIFVMKQIQYCFWNLLRISFGWFWKWLPRGGKCRGFGFVNYGTVQEATKARQWIPNRSRCGS